MTLTMFFFLPRIAHLLGFFFYFLYLIKNEDDRVYEIYIKFFFIERLACLVL
jgi:hypothetical protein